MSPTTIIGRRRRERSDTALNVGDREVQERLVRRGHLRRVDKLEGKLPESTGARQHSVSARASEICLRNFNAAFDVFPKFNGDGPGPILRYS